MKPAPQFAHYCTACQYLGSAPVDGKPTDWYLCRAGKRHGEATILGRHSDEVSDYWSTLLTLIPQMLSYGSAHARVARLMLREEAGSNGA